MTDEFKKVTEEEIEITRTEQHTRSKADLENEKADLVARATEIDAMLDLLK
jgi:hypothetical protein